MIALLLTLLCGTPSGWGADSLDCRLEDQNAPQTIAWARLYRAVCGGTGVAERVDSAMAGSGVETCFFIPDTSTCATYWITVVNGAEMESCFGQGWTFPRVAGVDYPVMGVGPEGGSYYDLSGRRLLSPPNAPGVYWFKRQGKKAKRIIVM